MNNKGFAATMIVYTIFIFLIALILLLLGISTSSLNSSIFGSNATKNHINKIVPYDVCLKEECE